MEIKPIKTLPGSFELAEHIHHTSKYTTLLLLSVGWKDGNGSLILQDGWIHVNICSRVDIPTIRENIMEASVAVIAHMSWIYWETFTFNYPTEKGADKQLSSSWKMQQITKVRILKDNKEVDRMMCIVFLYVSLFFFHFALYR